MKYCFNCGNQINTNDLFCNQCGIKLKSTQINKTKKDNSYLIISSIFTIIHLLIYSIGFIFIDFFVRLGNGFNGTSYDFKDLASTGAVAYILAFLPSLLATYYAFISKNKLLFIFNVLFLLINIIFFIYA